MTLSAKAILANYYVGESLKNAHPKLVEILRSKPELREPVNRAVVLQVLTEMIAAGMGKSGCRDPDFFSGAKSAMESDLEAAMLEAGE